MINIIGPMNPYIAPSVLDIQHLNKIIAFKMVPRIYSKRNASWIYACYPHVFNTAIFNCTHAYAFTDNTNSFVVENFCCLLNFIKI